MEIEKDLTASKLTMKVIGRLDTVTAPDLEKEITEGLDGVTDLALDFTDLEYISSAGLRVLLLGLKTMKGKGSFVVKNVNDIVNEVFEVTGFSEMLTIE